MLVTRAADYAVRVMIHLATTPPGERISLPNLAESTNTPNSFLSKILQTLARAGLIVSWRGNEGGFEILPSGREATVRAVIEAIDGPMFLNVCVTTGKGCDRRKRCPAHSLWREAQDQVVTLLDSASIADLAAKASATEEGHKSSRKVKIANVSAKPTVRIATSKKLVKRRGRSLKTAR
jgi:Rrf2 family protein